LQVTNFGPSPVNKMDLEFKIPVSYAEVKHFIQIDDIQVRIFDYVYTGTWIITGKTHERSLNLQIWTYKSEQLGIFPGDTEILSKFELSPNEWKFASTLNKSEGQKIENVGMYLEEPDFLAAGNYTFMLPCHVPER
jgi:hypothetical protein